MDAIKNSNVVISTSARNTYVTLEKVYRTADLSCWKKTGSAAAQFVTKKMFQVPLFN